MSRGPAPRPFRLAATLPPVSLSSGVSQSRDESKADGNRGGASRPDFPIGEFLPLAARPVLPGRTVTAGAAL